MNRDAAAAFVEQLRVTSKLVREHERLPAALHTIFCNTEEDAIRHHDYEHLAKDICECAAAALGYENGQPTVGQVASAMRACERQDSPTPPTKARE